MSIAVGFTGTRKGMTEEQRESVTRWLTNMNETVRVQRVIHGDCFGADEDFNEIAHSLGIRTHIRPCTLEAQRAHTKTWKKEHRPRPPLARNRDIVDEAEVLLATPGEAHEMQRSGTWSTVRYARETGTRVIIVLPNGAIDT